MKALSSQAMTVVSTSKTWNSFNERRKRIVSAATTGYKPLCHICVATPERSMRSARATSSIDRYTPLFTCSSTSKSGGQTMKRLRVGFSQSQRGRKEAIKSSSKRRRNRFIDSASVEGQREQHERARSDQIRWLRMHRRFTPGTNVIGGWERGVDAA